MIQGFHIQLGGGQLSFRDIEPTRHPGHTQGPGFLPVSISGHQRLELQCRLALLLAQRGQQAHHPQKQKTGTECRKGTTRRRLLVEKQPGLITYPLAYPATIDTCHLVENPLIIRQHLDHGRLGISLTNVFEIDDAQAQLGQRLSPFRQGLGQCLS